MKIYLDVIFLINFGFDFLLLFSVRKILRRNVKFKRLILASLIGALSIFLLFIKINNITLFLFKLVISILMILIAFSFRNLKYTLKNLLYLYILSIVLGGALYFINCSFSYKQEGIIFYHNGLSINIIILIMISPFILYTYIKESKNLKMKYNQLYEMNVTLKNKKNISLTAFLDTGNSLKDPFLKRPIIVTNEIDISGNYILVPFSTILNESFLKCYEVEKVYIKGLGEVKNVLLGISPKPIKMEGVDCIIGTNVLGGIIWLKK